MARSKFPSAPATATRILVVDDHPMVRERLTEVIQRESDLVVVGEAEDRSEAIRVAVQTHPDMAIVDLSLRNSQGIDLIKDLSALFPHMRLLVVSMHDESLHAERSLRAGAHGYITKQEATRNVLQAIRKILSGKIYLSPTAAQKMVERLTVNQKAGSAAPADLLSEREKQVFELTGRGLSTRLIGERLGIDTKTVETYRSRIKEKLSLDSSSDLLQLAIQHFTEQQRLLPTDPPAAH